MIGDSPMEAPVGETKKPQVTRRPTAYYCYHHYYLLFLGLFIVSNVFKSINAQQPQPRPQQRHSKALSFSTSPTANFSTGNYWPAGRDDQEDPFEQPIVISSVHSTATLTSTSAGSPPVYDSSGQVTSKRHKPPSLQQQQAGSSSWPRNTLQTAPKQQLQQPPQQQPSQEFDQNPNNSNSNLWMGQQHKNNWQMRQQQPQQQHSGFMGNINELQWKQRQPPTAPYAAMPQTPSTPSSVNNNNNNNNNNVRYTQTSQNAASLSLIRDTSQLADDNNNSHLNQNNQQQQQQVTDQQQQQQLWAQSIRDNHVGPIRSRYNLASGPTGSVQQQQPARVAADGFLMRATPTGKPTSFNWDQHQETNWPVNGNNNNNKAARVQPPLAHSQANLTAATTTTTTTSAPSTTATSNGDLSSRRNSKFTRKVDPSTTPLPPPTSITTSTESSSGQASDIATGSGQVTPLNETNLLLLAGSQKFEIDSVAQQQQQQQDDRPTMMSNNHSVGQRGKRPPANISHQKQGKSLFSPPDDEYVPAEARQQPQQQQQPGKQVAAGGWSRLLPALYQRAIASVLRRLTGAAGSTTTNQQQQQPAKATNGGVRNNILQQPTLLFEQQQSSLQSPQTVGPPPVGFQAPTSINSLLASALSVAAQAMGHHPQQQQQQPQHQPLRPNQMILADEQGNKQAASYLYESLMAATTGSLASPAGTLRQHANKKIIDSSIDLPASERRSDAVVNDTIDQATDPKRRRKAKMGLLEEESEEFETNNTTGLTHEELNASNSSSDNSMIEFDFRTTTERPGQAGPPDEAPEEEAAAAAAEAVEEDQEADEDRQVAAVVAEQTEPQAAAPKTATGRTLNDDETSEEVASSISNSVDNEDDDGDLLSEASEQSSEPQAPPPVFFYAPQSSHQLFQLISGKPHGSQQPSEDEDESGEDAKSLLYDIEGQEIKVRARKPLNTRSRDKAQNQLKVRPLRRPPIAPIEPNPFIPKPVSAMAITNEDNLEEIDSEEEEQIIKPLRRRRRPVSGHKKQEQHQQQQQQQQQQQATANRNTRLPPPIALSSVKPSLKQQQAPPKRSQQSSVAPKPLSVLAGQEESSSSAMMSPMSSSINVMDLDPSMTRLAHNKLIVAKYKAPNKKLGHRNRPPAMANSNHHHHQQQHGQQQMQYARSSSMMPPVAPSSSSTSTTQAAPLRRSNVDESLPEDSNNLLLDSSDREMRPTEASVANSLASVVLGSRVMTNKHISEIVSRWTRPNGNKPTSSRLNIEPMSAQSTTTTTTTPVPDQQAAELDGRAGPQTPHGHPNRVQSEAGGNPTFAESAAAAHWRLQQAAPSRNDKFNFSLMSMNNRERINPLMFPLEPQRNSGSASNSSLVSSINNINNKNKPSRVRVTTSTTTSTTTTSTTTTTKAPRINPQRQSSTHSPRPPATTKPSTTTTTTTTTASPTTKPAAMLQSTTPSTASTPVQDDSSLIGQIVRSQHKIKPIPSGGGLLLASPEHIRLRNQYLALVGGRGANNSLNSLSLLNTLMLHARSSPRPTNVVGGGQLVAVDDEPVVPVVKLEEAAHEANRYQLDQTAPTTAADANSEHSIVIMSDNHNHQRQQPQIQQQQQQQQQQSVRRTWPAHSYTPPALERPLVASMHYTSQAVPLEYEQQPSAVAATTTTMAPIERKHLEELVNGTRVRPSSQIKITTTTATPSTSTGAAENISQLWNGANNSLRRDKIDVVGDVLGETLTSNTGKQQPPVTMTLNNHQSSRATPTNLTANSQRLEAGQSDQHQVAKLDERAQELLMDLFDRDPAYSANLFEAHQLGLKGIKQQQQQQTDSGPMPTTSTTADPPQTTTQTPTTERSGHQPDGGWPSSPAPYDRVETGLEGVGQVTPSSVDLHQARSTDSMHRRPYDNQHEQQQQQQQYGTTPRLPGLVEAKMSEDGQQNNNHRASMRNNQALIQALLRDFSKRNNGSASPTTTAEPNPDLTNEQLDLGVQYARPTPPTTRWADVVLDTDRDSMNATSETSNEVQESTKFYSPFTSTTVAFQPASNPNPNPNRYPNVDTLGPGRQKINRPVQSGAYRPMAGYGSATTPAMSASSVSSEEAEQSSTTKLTESISNNDQVRASIRNRVTGATSSEPAAYGRPDGQDEASTPASGSFVQPQDQADVASSSGNRDDVVSLQGATSGQDDYESELINRKPIGNNKQRPVIIRSRPRLPQSGTGQQQQQQQRRPGLQTDNNKQRKPIRVQINNNDNKVISVKPNTLPKKRKNKPTKRPNQTTTTTESFADLLLETGGGGGGGGDLQVDSADFVQPPNGQAFILRPASSVVSNGATIIRKRPAYVRLPPENIRIHENSLEHATEATRNTTTSFTLNSHNGNNNNNHNHNKPISIIMPMETIVKRKDQDIRTRPLTIVDQSGNAHDLTVEQANELPAGLRRVPGTTIMHQNMVVTYKPGRPIQQFHSTTPIPFAETINITLHESSNNSYSIEEHHQHQQPPRAQLGSGNGGDTLLVSIEQQQEAFRLQQEQQAAASRRPAQSTTTTAWPATDGQDTTTTTSSSEGLVRLTTTTAAPSTTSSSQVAQRPIIVISGLNFGQHNNSTNHHNPPRTGGGNGGGSGGGKHSGSSLIEAASNSVVASASHGPPPSNNSRPAWPTGGVRHNNTASSGILSTGGGSGNSTFDNTFDFGNSANLTDSIVGPEIPNFGSTSSSFSSSSNNGHIGMPHLGQGSSLFGPRPNNNNNSRPSRWRVRKRPNGNGTSSSSSASYNNYNNNPYDYHSASSVSSIVYRPVGSRPGANMAQMFNWSALMRLYDNILIFFTRIRTFLLSLLFMFVPPLALTASIVSVMSA